MKKFGVYFPYLFCGQIVINFGILVCFIAFLIGSKEMKDNMDELLVVTKKLHNGAHQAMELAYDLVSSNEFSQVSNDYDTIRSKVWDVSHTYINVGGLIYDGLNFFENLNISEYSTSDIFNKSEPVSKALDILKNIITPELGIKISETLGSINNTSVEMSDFIKQLKFYSNTTIIFSKIKKIFEE